MKHTLLQYSTSRSPESKKISAMLSRIVCALFLLTIPSVAHTSELEPTGTKVVAKGTAHDAIYDVDFIGDAGFAVGAFGAILTTLNGGEAWTKVSSPESTRAILAVSVLEERQIAVGQSGLFLVGDGEAGWRRIDVDSQSRFFDVDANENGLVVAVGSFGDIQISKDFGESYTRSDIDWQEITDGGYEPHIYGVHVSEIGVITIVGEFELVLQSDDSGSTWRVAHKGVASLFTIGANAAGDMVAAGQDGAVINSSDRGESWIKLESGSKSLILGAWVGDADEVALAGVRGFRISNDGGKTWNSVKDREIETSWFSDVIHINSSGEFLLVGNAGRILKVKN